MILWETIGLNPVRNAEDIRAAIEGLIVRLAKLSPDELREFQVELHQKLYDLDRRELAEISVMLSNGSTLPHTSDSFLHSRAACVVSGEPAYNRSMASIDGFVRFCEPHAGAAEELLYLAGNEYERQTGQALEIPSLSCETGSNSDAW